MKMTKKLSKQICKELWVYVKGAIRKSPMGVVIDLKGNWKGWKKHGYMMSNCPCCQYARPNLHSGPDAITCKRCPLIKLWPNGCTKDDSPYTRAKDLTATKKSRLAACDEIINACG